MKLFFTFLCLITFTCFAQDEDYFDASYRDQPKILIDELLTKGAYKTLEEFKENNPTIDEQFIFTRDEDRTGIFAEKGNKLKFKNTNTNRVEPFEQSYFGYCDGKSVYINFRGKLELIYILSHYSLFEQTSTTYSPGYMGTGGAMVGGGMTTITLNYLLNIETGEIVVLTKQNLKQLLAIEEPDLLKQFNKEKGKNKKLISYVILLNKTKG